MTKKKEISELKFKMSHLDEELRACQADLAKRDHQISAYKEKIHELNQDVSPF